MAKIDIAVMAGDGIGPEVMAATLPVLDAACQIVGAEALCYRHFDAGAGHFLRTGVALDPADLAAIGQSDAILFGAMGLPDVRYADGTEVAPQIDLRVHFELFAGVRPIRLLPGVLSTLRDERARKLDIVIVRESTEGLFDSRGKGTIEGDSHARDTMLITRAASERVFRAAFEIARERKARGLPGCVTCVDKANVFKSFAFFRRVFSEIAQDYPDIGANCAYVDAVALNLVAKPWDFDVLVTENMFGDILSDLAAALVGGMGMAPSADIGQSMGVFQPSHGSAPDIAGRGTANPTAMILSGSMMLDWLGARRGDAALKRAGALIIDVFDKMFVQNAPCPSDLGGQATTEEISERAVSFLRQHGGKGG
uniref:isocitrate/isopropylmalate dehydrogenase family protein n=1 Tax=Pararhizobium sp. IMCC3301 TaxID=3067904 RepID=UPI00274134C1|nr:isocitrate/isopropylmalate family dehydrogenase [Pararhizobium sp. IMCC3301]